MKSIVSWVNRTLTHPRDRDGDYGMRVVVHFIPGFIVGLIPPPFDNNIVKLFLRYERNEDKWTKDEAWKDVGGFLNGFIVGRVALVTLILYYGIKVAIIIMKTVLYINLQGG